MTSFPQEPFNRRAVIVLGQHDLEKCELGEDSASMLYHPEVHILAFPPPTDESATLAMQNILDSGLARPGNVLVQDPYDPDCYVEAADANQRFALAKHMHFSTLCMLLGAKRVKVEQVELQTSKGKTTLGANGERLGSSVKAQVDIESAEKLRASMSLCDEFEGCAPDLQAAEHLLRKTGLLADPVMHSLFQMKRGGTNAIKKRTLCLNVSNEAKRNLKIVGELTTPAFLNLSTSLAHIATKEQTFTLTITVNF